MTERLTIDPAAILDRAAERIRPAKAWAVGTSARDQRGRQCDPVAAEACAWCATGAIFCELYAALPDRLPFFDRAQATERACVSLKFALDRHNLPSLETFIKANDRLGFTQAQVCDLLTDTAKRLREHGAGLTLTVA